MLLAVNFWRANKIWSALIVAWVSSLRTCGWLAQRVFFCLHEDIPGEQYVASSWTPCYSHFLGQTFVSSGSDRYSLQGEGHSGNHPDSYRGLCRMRSGMSPERFRVGHELGGLERSCQIGIMRLSCGFHLAEHLGQLLCYFILNLRRNFSEIVYLWSGSIRVLCQVTPTVLLAILLVNSCQFSPIPQSCHFVREK